MRKKHIGAAMLAIILLALFLPVFYDIVFYGSNMNYNEIHKIVTVEGNKVLLLSAVIGVLLFFLLYCVLRKIPNNRYSITGIVIVAFIVCILFYLVNVNISKCIAFYSGWDCGMVANSARWVYDGGELGYEDYYTIYSNNIPITWLLYKLYSFSSGLANYPYNPEFIWIQYQCIMLSAAVFISIMLVLLVSRKVSFSILALLFICLFLGLSPWKIIPYTDASTIAMPVLIVFLYALFRSLKSKWRYGLWFIIMFAGALGGIMKATCYVTLIAIIMVEFLWTLLEKASIKWKLKELTYKIILIVCAFWVASCCKSEMYKTLHYEYNRDLEIGWSNYLYNGLNEETTGACSGEGLTIVRSYADCSKETRMQYELESIQKRIAEKGGRGLLDFWLRKQVMNYNDGTFSWFQEGFFNAWKYENLTDSNWKEPLRKFFWEEGENYIWFTTLSQGIWIFVLLGVIVEAVMVLAESVYFLILRPSNKEEPSNRLCARTVTMVVFIGMFLFVMIFEGRARYLYNTIPVFSAMAIMGFCNLFDRICNFKWCTYLKK